MAIFDILTKDKTIKNSYAISNSKKVDNLLQEQLKGDIEQKTKSKFGKDFGEEHPFDYDTAQKIYEDFGLVTSVVDKIVDFVWGPGFFTKSDNANAKTIIDNWLQDVNFDSHGRKWLRQALIKGFSPLELGGSVDEPPQGVKLLKANNIYVKRDNKGKLLKYTQAFGNKEVNTFEPYQIAQLNIKGSAECAYGLGIIKPTFKILDCLFSIQSDMIKLSKRKSNSPIVAYLGDKAKGEIPDQADVDAFGEKLQYFNNLTEWAVGDNIRIESLNFGNVAENFDPAIQYLMKLLIYSYQVPQVLLGDGNIAEGLAKVQMDSFQRMITSIQVELEKVIEEKIFKRILLGNGLKDHVEFEWGQPSQDERNQKIMQITSLMNSAFISSGLRAELELQLADLMGVSPDKLKSKKQSQKDELEEPIPKVPKEKYDYEGHMYEGRDLRDYWNKENV